MHTLNERERNSNTNLSDSTSQYRFGVFGVYPKVLQKCNNAFMACFWLTIAKILSTVLTAGVVGATLPHVEKRFGFTSRQSSIFIAIFDFASVPALILACVLGAQCHKPRAIAVGMIMLSLSCVITVIPHFSSTTYMPQLQNSDNETISLCGDSDFKGCSKVGTELVSTTHWALVALIFARILCAFGNTPLNTLAYNYMHDVAPKEQFNIAVAALNMSMMVGTAIGYLAGAATLNLPHTWPYKPDFPKSSPNFVGAWWLSYIVIAVTTAVVALPIAAFPRDLPGADLMRKSRKTEAHKGQDDDETAIFVHWRDIGGHAKRLITNGPYVALALYYSINYSTTNGFADFAPKLVQTGFGLSAPSAAVAAGLTLVLAAPVGTIAATVLSNKLKLSCRTLMTWVCVISLTVCLFAPTLLTPCQGSELRISNETCSVGVCKCTDAEIQAVCGADGYTYKSACHAGCTSTNSSAVSFSCSY
ncbi:DgyrCDS10625 [Dimorphilus gyrociliatus]|uniref:DgyrCDS10625 n=1 Tax=Dimorphilus gyrociliatus TaxID=2664684 RepID=A0A7I8W0S8_9ANNE|nr:DgyrCDS10625 [Dimorphilus gyrociliatus]